MAKNLVVTGGSRGIGAATARLAAARDYAVCIVYRTNAQAAAGVVDEIAAEGGTATAFAADLTREGDVVRLFEYVDATLGSLDALVNNAGMLEPQARVDALDMDRLSRVFAANVYSGVICAREAVRRMSTRHGGRGGAIVNVSSVAARLGAPGEYVDYAAAKGAMDSFTIGLSKEVAAEGIRVNAVRPGVIYTDIHASGGEPGRVDRIKSAVPMQRGGEVDEVATAVMWLLSEEASYVTGAFVDVSGGR